MGSTERTLDELVVLRAQEGSEEAFGMLVERWQPRLWQHARRLTGRDDAASDVVQEAWLGVVQGLGRLRDVASFRRWVFSIVTRRAAQWQRGRGRLETRETELEREPAEPVGPVASAVELMREALQRLPPERQALLALHHLEGFEQWEIAEILHVPEGTVKSRLHHARAELREIIERIDR